LKYILPGNTIPVFQLNFMLNLIFVCHFIAIICKICLQFLNENGFKVNHTNSMEKQGRICQEIWV